MFVVARESRSESHGFGTSGVSRLCTQHAVSETMGNTVFHGSGKQGTCKGQDSVLTKGTVLGLSGQSIFLFVILFPAPSLTLRSTS